MKFSPSLLFSLCVALTGCEQDAVDAPSTPPASSAGASQAASEKPAAAATEPLPAFEDGARIFEQVKDTLLEQYYREGLDEDDVYRAAVRGMVEHLDPSMSKWNRFLTPAELAQMHADLKGEVVGVGLHMDFDAKTGHSRVLRTIAGSPAEKAGVRAGDVIVAVDGELFQGKAMSDVIARMRGKVGETVELSVLRGRELLSLKVLREVIAFDATKHMLLSNEVGYLRIASFNEKVPAAARNALEALRKAGASSLVVDLRCNAGGALDPAIATAGALLPKGTPIVVVHKRGGDPETYSATGDGALLDVPLAVLVNGATGSSPEFITAALVESRHARVVGVHTLGKWTVQKLDELPNGYGIKYTVGLLKTSRGASYDGVGFAPEVEVAMTDEELDRAMQIETPAERLAADAQLRTAVGLLAD